MLRLKVTTGPNSGPQGFRWGEEHGSIKLPESLSKEDAEALARDLGNLMLSDDNHSHYDFELVEPPINSTDSPEGQ